MEVKKSIIVNGKKYRLMKIGIPVSNEDVRFESSWYTLDPRKQEEDYNPFGEDKEGRAIWECLKRMYKEAKPPADIEKIAKSGEGKMRNFFMAYYLPQKRCSQIVEEVCKEFKLTGMSKRCVQNSLWMGSAPNSSEKTWKEERKDYKERLKKHLEEKNK